MKENNIYKNIGIKVAAAIYMTVLTIFVSYNISKIQEEYLWENERTAITVFLAMAFMVTMIYLMFIEKELIISMIIYHVVLFGTLACTSMPVKFMPFMFIPMLVTAVYNMRAGFVAGITVTCVLLMGFGEYPLYVYGVIMPAINATACFAACKYDKRYKNILGIVFFTVFEILFLYIFKYYCADTGMEYEDNEFAVCVVMISVISLITAKLIGAGADWIFRKKTPWIILKKISDDDYMTVKLIKNKSASLYYHSTEVAELSRVAARRIGADEHLAYAGGLYHDFGKLIGSEYIKEGLILAEKYKLPDSVKAIMMEHNIKSRLPRTKEAAIVMLCDTAISAVEYLKGTMDKKDISEKTIMENALNKRAITGSLKRSGLTMEEFDKIKEVLIKIKEQQ